MRENALFLLSLLVVVSVGVTILDYTRLHGFVCVRKRTRALALSNGGMYDRLKRVAMVSSREYERR